MNGHGLASRLSHLSPTTSSCSISRELKKLSEESLTRQPEEVFDILSKLGEGSYGSVYKAIHKESSQVLAIKQVPVDTDLQEIIKEISIMQQCDSPYVVKYYGSYFKNTDLWVRQNLYLGFCKDMNCLLSDCDGILRCWLRSRHHEVEGHLSRASKGRGLDSHGGGDRHSALGHA